jgi:hypothetical protein
MMAILGTIGVIVSGVANRLGLQSCVVYMGNTWYEGFLLTSCAFSPSQGWLPNLEARKSHWVRVNVQHRFRTNQPRYISIKCSFRCIQT